MYRIFIFIEPIGIYKMGNCTDRVLFEIFVIICMKFSNRNATQISNLIYAFTISFLGTLELPVLLPRISYLRTPICTE